MQLEGGSRTHMGYQNMASSSSALSPPVPRTPPDICGRHRKRAELKRLQDEIRLLEEELHVLGDYPLASNICREFVHFANATPDPLLSGSQELRNPEWDRWFQDLAKAGEGVCCWGI